MIDGEESFLGQLPKQAAPELHPRLTPTHMQLGWVHWERQQRRRITAAFPPSYPLF